MNLQAEKIKLAQFILSVDSEDLIQKIKGLVAKQKTDFWDELPDSVKQEIELAVKELERGEGIEHEVAFKKYEQWLKK